MYRSNTQPEALVASFSSEGLALEVFCQDLPVTQQHAFRHMVIEGRLLVLGGEALRDKIVALKRAGTKTEPAFAAVLGLSGDPYAALLRLEAYSDARLVALLQASVNAPVIELFQGERESLRELFRLADDSEQELAAYMSKGVVFVAKQDDHIVGHLQLIGVGGAEAELKSMAVSPALQGAGVGARLIEAARQHCQAAGSARILVSTAAAGVGQLRFYQRAGFRMLRIERDFFTASNGYSEEIRENGILLRDQVWLSLDL
jgi:GNAT superfamily N-acetyltransferase